MTFAWIHPRDASVLAARPLLDLGTGDGQTLRTLVSPEPLLVGADRSAEALAAARSAGFPLVRCQADELPFADSTFGVVLAADLFHHLDEDALAATLAAIWRALRPGGGCVAWWYERSGRPGPDAPPFPRSIEVVASAAADFDVDPLPLSSRLETAATVGLILRRRR